MVSQPQGMYRSVIVGTKTASDNDKHAVVILFNLARTMRSLHGTKPEENDGLHFECLSEVMLSQYRNRGIHSIITHNHNTTMTNYQVNISPSFRQHIGWDQLSLARSDEHARGRKLAAGKSPVTSTWTRPSNYNVVSSYSNGSVFRVRYYMGTIYHFRDPVICYEVETNAIFGPGKGKAGSSSLGDSWVSLS
jgi:hypothetical protein